eukprot:208291_1
MERRSNSSGSVPTKILLITLTAVAINADGCIRSHPNYTIDYISNNLNNDPSIRYLGTKPSATDCQNSCQNLNYLCDKSSSDASRSSHFDPWFDNANCEITIPNGDVYVSLTDDLVAKEYIIEAQFTITDEWEAGIYFKSNYYNVTELFTDASSLSYEYFFGITPVPDTGHGFTGYWHVENAGESGHHILSNASTPTNITYNTMYTLQVHVHDNDFVTYIDGDVHFSSYSYPLEKIDESLWTNSYAGVYVWDGGGIVHSFKVIFPDASDDQDDKVCAAYIYDTVDGDCHGYYGNNYAQIEASLSPNMRYESAVIYATCPPTPRPTSIPTETPTGTPTSFPTTKTPTTRSPIIIAYEQTRNPTPFTSEIDTISSSTLSTRYGGTQAPKSAQSSQTNTVSNSLLVIMASLLIICLCLCILLVYYKYFAKSIGSTFESNASEKNKEDVMMIRNPVIGKNTEHDQMVDPIRGISRQQSSESVLKRDPHLQGLRYSRVVKAKSNDVIHAIEERESSTSLSSRIYERGNVELTTQTPSDIINAKLILHGSAVVTRKHKTDSKVMVEEESVSSGDLWEPPNDGSSTPS